MRGLLVLALLASLAPGAAAEEGLSWAEVREVTLQRVEAPSIWPATAACGAIIVLSLGLAILKRR